MPQCTIVVTVLSALLVAPLCSEAAAVAAASAAEVWRSPAAAIPRAYEGWLDRGESKASEQLNQPPHEHGTILLSRATRSARRKHASRDVADSDVKLTVKQFIPRRHWWSLFRFSLSFAFIIKAMCITSNVFYQASPIPLVRQFSAKGDTVDADLAPFVSMAFGGWQWCFYGLFAFFVTSKNGFLVLVYSNMGGAILGLYYVFMFMKHCKNDAMLKRASMYYFVLGVIVAVQAGAIASLPPVRALFFSGLVSSSWSVVTSLSLLTTVPEVLRTKCSHSLPFPILIVSCMSASLWIVCGTLLWDVWILLPNTVSFFTCTFALCLCIRYPRAPARSCDALPEEEEEATHQPPAVAMAGPAVRVPSAAAWVATVVLQLLPAVAMKAFRARADAAAGCDNDTHCFASAAVEDVRAMARRYGATSCGGTGATACVGGTGGTF